LMIYIDSDELELLVFLVFVRTETV